MPLPSLRGPLRRAVTAPLARLLLLALGFLRVSAEYANPREVRVKYVRAEARRRAHRAAPHAPAALRSGRKRLTALPGNFAALTRPVDLLICTHSSFLEILFLDARWAAPLAFPLPPRLTGPFALPPPHVEPGSAPCLLLWGTTCDSYPPPRPAPALTEATAFHPAGHCRRCLCSNRPGPRCDVGHRHAGGRQGGRQFPILPPVSALVHTTHTRTAHTHTHTSPPASLRTEPA